VVTNEEIINIVLARVSAYTGLPVEEILHEKTRVNMFVVARTLVCGLLNKTLRMTADQLVEKLPVGRSQVYRYLDTYHEIVVDDSGDLQMKRHQVFISETISELMPR